MKLGKFDAALKDWNAAILSRKSDFRAFRWRGECYLEMKQANDALSDFDKAISISPNNPELYQMRSRAYTILGKTELAKSDTEHWRQLREKSANELDN
jgi:tetratricopeptide (TPR) repeat protein